MATLVLALLAVAGIAWWRALTPPAWWNTTPGPSELAEQLEGALIDESTRVRPTAEAWTLAVREESVNAWLAGRLESWMRSRGTHPGELAGACVRIVDGEFFAAAREQGGRVVWSASVKPDVSVGSLRLGVTSAAIGRLSIPSSWIAQGLGNALGAQVLGPTVVVGSELRLADRRRVQLLDVRCGEGFVTLTCRTLPRGD